MTVPVPVDALHAAEERVEILREGATMLLYVAVVEIAELTALPEQHFSNGVVTGPVGATLLAIIWGTAVGLALVHWFAFGVAGRAFRGKHITRLDVRIGLAQLTGAAIVAGLSSIPALFFSDLHAQEWTGYIPAVVIGVFGYFVARTAGSSRTRSIVYGTVAIALGIGAALAKTALAAH